MHEEKADGQVGVGYEGDVMTAEVLSDGRQKKFIPVLRAGDWGNTLPSWLLGKLSIDLRGDPYSDEQYGISLDALHGRTPQAPSLGLRTDARSPRSVHETTAHERQGQPPGAARPVRIVG